MHEVNAKKIWIFHFADICGTLHNYTLISELLVRAEEVLAKVKGHFTTYVFKEDEIILYDDENIKRVNDNDLVLNVKFQREVIAVLYKKVEY